jgi:hypothetical protein
MISSCQTFHENTNSCFRVSLYHYDTKSRKLRLTNQSMRLDKSIPATAQRLKAAHIERFCYMRLLLPRDIVTRLDLERYDGTKERFPRTHKHRTRQT